MKARQRRAELAQMRRLTTAGEMTAEIAHQINQADADLGMGHEPVSRPRSPVTISPALDVPGGVAPPRNIPDIPASARLARDADGSPI
jgi:hypothetical protein